MRRAVKDLGLPLAQFGVRAMCLDEVEARKEHGVTFHDASTPAAAFPNHCSSGFSRQVYLTFDVDGLDPSIMPATGTPVPGGLGYQSLDIAERTLSGRDVLGFDVVELAPVPGMHASISPPPALHTPSWDRNARTQVKRISLTTITVYEEGRLF